MSNTIFSTSDSRFELAVLKELIPSNSQASLFPAIAAAQQLGPPRNCERDQDNYETLRLSTTHCENHYAR
jgi:hypothetical protein